MVGRQISLISILFLLNSEGKKGRGKLGKVSNIWKVLCSGEGSYVYSLEGRQEGRLGCMTGGQKEGRRREGEGYCPATV